MKKNKKKGFTLVELLAVIVVLAIILVIAVPKILDVIESSRENSLISSVKLIARNAEQKKLTNEVLGEDEDFDCSEVADLSQNDYQSCIINFDEEGNATVSIIGKGKFSEYTCSGTKNNVTCGDEEPLVCAHGYEYDNYRTREDLTDTEKNICVSKMEEFLQIKSSGYSFDDDIPNIICKNEYPGGLTENEYFNDISYTDFSINNVNELIKFIISEYGFSYEYIKDYVTADDVIGCIPNYLSQYWEDNLERADTYLGGHVCMGCNATQSITFSNRVSDYDGSGIDISQAQDGAIKLYQFLDDETKLYDVYIVSSEKIYFPVNSFTLFFDMKGLKSIDFGDDLIDTSRVVDMSYMFYECYDLEELDLSDFDTSNVTDMSSMFCYVEHSTVENSNFEAIDNSQIYVCSI